MTVHSPSTSLTACVAKLGAAALVVASLSACVIAPLGYGHHGRGHGGRHLAAEAAPVVVAPPPAVLVVPQAPHHGYPRPYRY
jgi:hypothetical protein